MSDRFDYARMQATATRLLGRFKQGRVTVIRTTQAEKPDDWPTWQPWEGETTTNVYELDAVVKGVSAKLVDGDAVVATDLELTCSHKMVLVEVDGVAVTPAPVAFDATLLDTLNIDGRPVTIVRDLTVPAAGMPVAHRYVVRA
ncbi:hypothetical protein [Aquamicrobium sp. LC103]|uniref:hypothetical protein n=1 Tax=Aquamicrobium sp. LC103 TaxID=1120658 RepID=UPI00069A7228|nr:hypothetical protein [Aquamicrobium sp. LC103]TKT79978.1 hypothetical protein XW59_006340 [Aquamicrobium sp. LC103]